MLKVVLLYVYLIMIKISLQLLYVVLFNNQCVLLAYFGFGWFTVYHTAVRLSAAVVPTAAV